MQLSLLAFNCIDLSDRVMNKKGKLGHKKADEKENSLIIHQFGSDKTYQKKKEELQELMEV